MGRRWTEFTRRPRRALYILLCVACAALLTVACTPEPDDKEPPPVEDQVELKTGTVEPKETRGAPYPPVEPSERIPNLDDEEWPPVPDGPKVGDMQPANPQAEVKEVEIKE